MKENHSCDLTLPKSKKPQRQLKLKKKNDAKHSCDSCDFAAKTKASCTMY